MDKIRITLYDLLTCMSNAQELVSPKLINHHQQVAYLSFRIAEHIKLPVDEQNDIFLASLIHDIGALSANERLEILETEPITVNSHAFRGARLIEDFKPLKNAAKIIKYHHVPWVDGKGQIFKGEQVPLASHIIHLADRVSALVRSDRNILTQVPGILTKIVEKKGTAFEPGLVDALVSMSKKECIWLDFTSRAPADIIFNTATLDTLVLEVDDILDLALIFSRIIDFRSNFTARHSAGVAKTAEKLARLLGFSVLECKMMLIAGYLHDLGKIAISDDILEKPAKLDEEEFNIMRAHTYYTYRLLEPLSQLRIINAWASFHHEKLNGTGYPFHIKGDNLPLGSRIMAVADVYTAIAENRPYRKGMEFEEIKKILLNMVDRALDKKVVETLIDNFDEIDAIRENAQLRAAEEFKDFMSGAKKED